MIADVPQAIEAVRRLYFDRKLGQQFGVHGREFVQRFGIATQVEAWHRTFQEMLGPQPNERAAPRGALVPEACTTQAASA